jgi:hypothetical protein
MLFPHSEKGSPSPAGIFFSSPAGIHSPVLRGPSHCGLLSLPRPPRFGWTSASSVEAERVGVRARFSRLFSIKQRVPSRVPSGALFQSPESRLTLPPRPTDGEGPACDELRRVGVRGPIVVFCWGIFLLPY